MNRREFLALSSVAALARGSTEPMSYERLRQFIAPGHDEFPEEKIAMEVAARLRAAKPGRYYPLPGDRVRFEIAEPGQYRTGYYKMNWSAGDTAIQGVLDEQIASAPEPLFREITPLDEQLAKGIPYWRARLDPACGIDVYGNKGIAVGDIDNDGADEIYVCQPGGLPNRLFKYRDGVLEDLSERAGVNLLDDTSSALFVDWRNIGHQDLLLLTPSGPLLMLNDGTGRFTPRPDAFQFARPPQGSFTGMAAADYDRDGAVDVYLCTYVYFQSEAQYRYPVPYHDAQNGPPNYLFRNRLGKDGSGHFEDVTEASGIDQNNNRYSFAAAWCDYDSSGWPSVYVANDFGRNNLYKNEGGKFRDVAAEAGVEDIGPGMSAAWFDYDGDGRFDLYVSNMWSDSGQRITSSKAFQPAQQNPEAYRRHTKGNSLYRNLGNGRFEETGAKECVEVGRWAWASDAHDFDNDGSPEIFITCGMLSNQSAEDTMSFFWRKVVAQTGEAYEEGWNAINQYIREDLSWSAPEPNLFYVRRNGRYVDYSGVSGLDFAGDSRAFAVTDFDGDGALDLIVKNRLAPQLRVFQNNCAGSRHSIAFSLRGVKSNRDAIGAVIQVDGQVKQVQAGSGFLSQHTKKLYFGLGQSTTAKHVQVQWPSGTKQTFASLAAGHLYQLTEGSPEVASTLFAPHRVVNRDREGAAGRVDNTARLHDTWFLEPLPLPIPAKAPGLLVVEPTPVWSIFRRYLFDYRVDLKSPMLLLIGSDGKARKIYAKRPTTEQVRADLAMQDPPALPFAGRYELTAPKRDYFKLGAAFFAAGLPDYALPYLEEVVRRSPANERAWMAIAQIHLAAGREDKARVAMDKVLAIAPQSAAAADNLGLHFAEKGLYPQARDLFQRAISLQRNNASAINNLGVLYMKMGQMNDAVAAFRYGIGVAPEDGTLYLNLGRSYIQTGDREKARGVIMEWLDHKPGDGAAQRALRELDSR